jgi:hypothetical protein
MSTRKRTALKRRQPARGHRSSPRRFLVAELSRYMRARAAMEGVAWELTNAWLQDQFDAGFRLFFGVTVTHEGTLVKDVQQPLFFADWRAKEHS